MKKIILIISFIANSYFSYSQVIKSVELTNSVNFCKININYNNPNNKEGKGVNFNPSVGITFLKYKYINLGLLFELKTEGYKEKLPFTIITNNGFLDYYYNSKEEINFISFGLKLNPKYCLNKFVVIYANLNPYLNYRNFTTNTFDMLIKSYENNSEKIIPSLNYGLGTALKIASNIKILIEFSANYYFMDVIDNNLVNVKINSYGFKTGLRYSFGKKEKAAEK